MSRILGRCAALTSLVVLLSLSPGGTAHAQVLKTEFGCTESRFWTRCTPSDSLTVYVRSPGRDSVSIQISTVESGTVLAAPNGQTQPPESDIGRTRTPIAPLGSPVAVDSLVSLTTVDGEPAAYTYRVLPHSGPLVPTRMRSLPTPEASVIPDATDPQLLHINLFRHPSNDSDTDYLVRLENREFVRFIERPFRVSLTAIPARVRVRVREPGDPAEGPTSARFNAAGDFTAGLYFNWSRVERYFRYERGLGKTIQGTGRIFNRGLLLGASIVSVGAANGTRDRDRFANGSSVSMLVLSPGVGVGMGYDNAVVNVFAGVDVGVLSGAGSWDYQYAPWIGVGISSSKLLPF